VTDTHAALREFFPYQRLALEVVYDPEVENDLGQLVMYVNSDHDPAGTFSKMQDFDLKWWYENMDRANGMFFVNVDFA
jgi:hypothetical protein